MRLKDLKYKYPKSIKIVDKYVWDSYGFDLEVLDNELLNDMYTNFITKGLLIEFFDEQGIFLYLIHSTNSSWGGDFSCNIQCRSELERKVVPVYNSSVYLSRSAALTLGIHKCFKILEDRLTKLQ